MKVPARHAPWPRRAALLAGVLALAGGLAGCGETGGDPVARLTVEPGHLELPYGAYADLRFRWVPLVELEGSPRVFVHLLDVDGNLVRTFDHEPAGGWPATRELDYETRIYQSLLAPPLPPGTYTLTAGLYDPDGGRRWALETAGEDVGRSEYEVATVEVPARAEGAAAAVPAVQFTPSWSPTLAGGDRQVIAFRWLSGEGAIRLDELSSGGTAWLSLSIPAEQVGNMKRRIVDPPEGGDGIPRVKLTSSCSGFEAQVYGEGTHGIEVPVEPAGKDCEIHVDPNFVLESESDDRRSLILEVFAWNPARG